jgi:hypothetical protein
VSSYTKDIDRGFKKILQEMAAATRKEVAVGILAGSVSEGQSIAEYATYNEFGTEKIPSRPFMASTFDRSLAAISSDFNTQGAKLAMGKISANTALTVIGQKHADRIKNTISTVNFLPKLAPGTISAKKGSTKTLVDTGAMLNAVQISVRNRSAK